MCCRAKIWGMEKLPNKGATWKFDEFSGEEEISTKSTASKLFKNDILLTHYKDETRDECWVLIWPLVLFGHERLKPKTRCHKPWSYDSTCQ